MTTEATPGALGSNEGLGPLLPARAAFEAWMRERSDHFEYVRALPRLLTFGARGMEEASCRYHDHSTQEAWESWKAAKVAERTPENVIRLALMHAAFVAPDDTTQGQMRSAAVALFGADAVDAALRSLRA